MPQQHPRIVHDGRTFLVLDKPANLSLLADRSGQTCYWDIIKSALGDRKPLLVHRLDKGTSGALLVALKPDAQRTLTRAFHNHSIHKFYLAWVVGRLHLPVTHTIDLPLKKGRKSRYRVAGERAAIQRLDRGWQLTTPAEDAHASLTRLRTLATTSSRSLLLVQPRSGRTHQLRVHLSWIGHPIVGDHLYGMPANPAQRAARLQLHCHRLTVPGFGSFRVPPGADFIGASDPRGC